MIFRLFDAEIAHKLCKVMFYMVYFFILILPLSPDVSSTYSTRSGR